jgi:hypothetical protein
MSVSLAMPFQITWFPGSVSEESPVRVIDAFVGALDREMRLVSSSNQSYAIADYVARAPAVNGVIQPYIIGEVKTGNASLTATRSKSS